MYKVFCILFGVCLFAQTKLPHTQHGKLVHHENFSSKYVMERNVTVWLPENYSPKKTYAVLYMHDGQMLFDSTITWNKQEWMVDELLSSPKMRSRLKPVIVVGIWNTGQYRHSEYFPQKPFERYLSIEQQNRILEAKRGDTPLFPEPPNSDNYLKFIVEELKPFIDSTYSTRKDQKNTFIAGSSMGGLISLYALCEYPDIFGGTACISTHWPGIMPTETNNPFPKAMFDYLLDHLPSPKQVKIYFDYGTGAYDEYYEPYQLEVDMLKKEKKFTSKNWVTRKFEGEPHNEKAWAKRLHIPLTFLLSIK